MNRAILRHEIANASRNLADLYAASLSLACTQRRIAGEYRTWAREAEAAGNLAHYRRYAPMARETFRAAIDNLNWARHYRDLAEWRQ